MTEFAIKGCLEMLPEAQLKVIPSTGFYKNKEEFINMEKKKHLAQLNDINGNFILFKLVPTTTEEMASIPEQEFKKEFRKQQKNIEIEIPLKGVPFRTGVILHEDGKRYGFQTNISKEK